MMLRRFQTFAIPLVLALTLCPPLAHAVTGELGLRGGWSIARLHGEVPPYVNSLHSVAGGASVAFPIGSSFAIRPELLYVTKGMSLGKSESVDEHGNIGTVEALLAASYLEVPILARATLSSGSLRWGFLLGPTFAFELNEQFKMTGAIDHTEDINELKGTDIGLAMGVELGIPLGRGHLTMEPRYTLSFTDIEQPTVGDNGIRNTAFTLMAGYAYPFGH